MTKSNFNLSPIYAEGFVGTYVNRESPEREKVVAELVYVFEIAYGSGWSAGQRELAHKLLALSNRESYCTGANRVSVIVSMTGSSLYPQPYPP